MTLTKDAAFWTRKAPAYAKSAIADPSGYERTLARTANLIAGRSTVLELGCGTGMTALRLAPLVGSYLATDLSPGMISQARARAGATPPDGLVFTTATARDLATERLRVGAVLGFSYLHLLRDLVPTLDAIHTMLDPGGLFISKTPLVGEMSPLIRAAIRPAQWLGLAPHVLMLTEDGLRNALVAAGFQIMETARHGSGAKDTRLFIVARKA